ncbi:MAG: hypothetical protein ACFFFC_20325 [Candidatus Thorarchaeota archaeon]
MGGLAVRILHGSSFDMDSVITFMLQQAQRKGVLRREQVEEIAISPPLLRPFREVLWDLREDVSDCRSLIDESVSHVSLTPDQQLLLWRPQYAHFDWIDDDSIHNIANFNPDDSYVQALVDDLLERRMTAQRNLDESEVEARKSQAAKKSALAFLIPRSPGSIRKQEEMEEGRRPSQGILVASSLVMNCPQNSRVVRGKLGLRFWVRTMMTEFRNLETQTSRFVFLESPTSASLREAVSFGRALTRLCQLNEDARSLVHRQFLVLGSTES